MSLQKYKYVAEKMYWLSWFQGFMERLDRGPVIGDGGFVFALEKRGYVEAGPWTPQAVIEEPEVLSYYWNFNFPTLFSKTNLVPHRCKSDLRVKNFSHCPLMPFSLMQFSFDNLKNFSAINQ